MSIWSNLFRKKPQTQETDWGTALDRLDSETTPSDTNAPDSATTDTPDSSDSGSSDSSDFDFDFD